MVDVSTSGTLIHDESATNQNSDVNFSDLSAAFQSYLTTNSLTTGIIEEAKGLTITVAAEGSTVTNLFFSDASGNPLPTSGTGIQVFDTLHPDGGGGYLPLQTKDGENIYLFGDSTNPDIAIAKDASGDIVAIFYLNDPTNLSATVEMVQYQALFNQDPTLPDADYVNWGDQLSVSASGTLEFNFNNLDSGHFAWVAVGTSDAGMIVTGSRLNVNSDGTLGGSGKTASDIVNTSQGGDGATIGIDNQMFTPGDSAIFTLVENFGLLPASAGDATGQDLDQILHDGYLDTSSAELFVSQRQGNDLLDISMSIFEAGSGGDDEDSDGGAAGPYAEGVTLVGNGKNQTVGKSDTFTDDTPIDIVSVEVKQGTTTVGIWTTDAAAANADANDNIFLEGTPIPNGQPFAGIKVSIDGNDCLVENVDAGYSIKINSGSDTFNRIELGSMTGNFDIGKFLIDTPAGDTDVIGDNIQGDDDGPSISAQISNAVMDQGSTTPISNSLNGVPGADTNAHYTIDKYDNLAGFIEEETLDTDGGVVGVSYYVDTDPGAGETKGALAFTLTLSDSANSGAGSYTFTNYLPAPPGELNFDFTYFPSGNSLFGILLDDEEQSDLTPDTGLLVLGRDILLDSAGHMSPTSNSINTSQGGGSVTIGVNNQMFDPGDGAVFVYLDHPERNSSATAAKGDGLTQNTADDADALGFAGTLEVRGGSIEVVQLQGGGTMGMKLTAFDLADDDAIVAATDPLGAKKNVNDDVSAEARGWVDNDDADPATHDDALSSGTEVKIDSVSVYDTGSLTPKATFTIASDGTVTPSGVTNGIDVNTSDSDGDGVYEVTVLGFDDNDTIAFTTAADHDALLVEGVSGAWDVGGFNIQQGVANPDILLNFSVAVTDKDGDSYSGSAAVIDDFTIKLDGSGTYNEDPNVLPPVFSSSYDLI
jgi:hypothetical protein